MAGPTFFSSVVDIFMDFCSDGHELKTYFILLIITDGSIHDMRETKQLIVQASKLPCSIIIVGVGNANFEQMVELDSDETLLKDNKNNFAKRDIVQFVQFRKAVARGNLAEELLKEIPDQVCRYMEMTGYKPVPVNTDASKIEESVAKQIAETIQSQKGKRKAKKNEAKDVIDKDSLFTDDVKRSPPASTPKTPILLWKQNHLEMHTNTPLPSLLKTRYKATHLQKNSTPTSKTITSQLKATTLTITSRSRS